MSFVISLIGLALIIVIAFNEIYQQKMKVSPMPTPASTRRAMLDAISHPAPKMIAELGSGWGGIALEAARRYPQATVVGYECSPFPLLAARIRKLCHPTLKNLSFQNKNFFHEDLGQADVILCYLSIPHMAQLEPKFERELPTGAQIISSTFPMPHWPLQAEKLVGGLYDTKIYIYEKTADLTFTPTTDATPA